MPSRPPYPPSDHFDGRLFFNPGADTDRTLGDLLRWRREGRRTAWPPAVINPPAAPPPTQVAADEIAFTFIGQATYLIRTANLVLLTDPIFSDRASPFSFAGPRRVRPPGVELDRLPPIDLILLSHNHYDHMDLPSLRALQARRRTPILTGLGNGAYLARKGVEGAIELDWWQQVEPAPGTRVTYVPAQHWSSRTMRDRRRMLWGGFVVETAAGRVYFAGDTGFFSGFGAIRARSGAPDVALLPIGAYEPRWFMKAQHMNPADAVEAHQLVGAGQSFGMHWGTFQLTDEGIDEPLHALDLAKAAAGLDPGAFLAPAPGETVIWRKPAVGTTVDSEDTAT
jgi:L-ascorbate metabolism protein UlaG (beta-lactamase superfamily)